jgi:hypothetical protein
MMPLAEQEGYTCTEPRWLGYLPASTNPPVFTAQLA